MANAVGYVRVSTEEQHSKGYGLEVQKEEITNYSNLKNIALDKIYEDPGFSGSEMSRPALMRLFEDSKKGHFKYLIVYKTDRLARDNYLSWWIEKELKKNNIELISITEPYRLDDPSGRLFFAMISAFADYEREIIKMRLVSGRNQKAKNGGYAGGNLSFGYSVKDGKLIINEDEAKVVLKIFRDYAKGKSMGRIANELNSGKIQTKRNGNWYPVTIQSILANPLYAHSIKYNGIESKGVHEPIVSKRLFNQVQELRQQRSKRWK